jgi:hypothetical protein
VVVAPTVLASPNTPDDLRFSNTLPGAANAGVAGTSLSEDTALRGGTASSASMMLARNAVRGAGVLASRTLFPPPPKDAPKLGTAVETGVISSSASSARPRDRPKFVIDMRRELAAFLKYR